MGMKKLVIEGNLPGLNEYTKACRSNRFAGSKMKKEAESLISAYIMQQMRGISFEGAVTVNFRWYERNRKRDLDNICFSKKFILDALVSKGIIESDGWRGVNGFMDYFFIDAEHPRIEVLIFGNLKER